MGSNCQTLKLFRHHDVQTASRQHRWTTVFDWGADCFEAIQYLSEGYIHPANGSVCEVFNYGWNYQVSVKQFCFYKSCLAALVHKLTLCELHY